MRRNAVPVIDDVLEKPAIEVRDNAGFKGVYAKLPIERNSVILHLRGTISARPSKYTIQLSSNQHLNLPAIKRPKDHIDYCWQYLNHCCEPNGYMKTAERTFRALRDIAPGEEINFNYLTTEWEMAEPFNCHCGSANCFGFIQGRNFLTLEQVERLMLIFGEDNVVTLFMPPIRKGTDIRSLPSRARMPVLLTNRTYPDIRRRR
jgi:hypothetical protein